MLKTPKKKKGGKKVKAENLYNLVQNSQNKAYGMNNSSDTKLLTTFE